jgi:hypothetical protein
MGKDVELKRCPFCGGDVMISGITGQVFGHSETCPIREVRFLAEKWNARPVESALQARIEELEKQEVGGARVSIDHQIDKDLQAEIGISEVENDNIQLLVCRMASFCQSERNETKALQTKLNNVGASARKYMKTVDRALGSGGSKGRPMGLIDSKSWKHLQDTYRKFEATLRGMESNEDACVP